MDGCNDGSPPLDLRSLKALSILGRGGNGLAFLVRDRASNETLALKTISKASIEKKKNEKHSDDRFRRIRFELDTLKELQHPLLPKLRGFLATEKIIGFAIEYCSGGHLNALRKRQSEEMFSDSVIRFYAAELVLALEYLHGLGIVYRDLKPENVLVQGNGHLMLIDFDLSIKLPVKKPVQSQRVASNRSETRFDNSAPKSRFPSFLLCRSGFRFKNPVDSASSDLSESDSLSSGESEPKSMSFVGTEDYVAPEIIAGSGHDFAVDWWSLGVLLYEMLYGRTPFRGVNRKETFYRILSMPPDLVGETTPLRDLIGRLLEKDPAKRISVESIKAHEFFRGVDWEEVHEISRPPFIPEVRGEEETERDGEIDVEDFVERVFRDSGEKSEKKTLPEKERKNDDNNNNKNNDNNNNINIKKGVWVDALRDTPKNAEDLLVF